MEYRAIEIDFHVHNRIEAERMGFGPNDVLRRLLKIEENKAASLIGAASQHGRAWTGKGVTLRSDQRR